MATANLSCDELSFSSRLNVYLIPKLEIVQETYLGRDYSSEKVLGLTRKKILNDNS